MIHSLKIRRRYCGFTLMRLIHLTRLGIFLCAVLPFAATAQIGGTGWKPQTVSFKIQSPTNAPQSARYFFTNNIYHCLVFSNDGAFAVGNTTLPRTEQRFNPDYTSGEIQYQAVMLCPSNENSYCCFQIHTGDAQSPTYGSTTFMAFWFTNSGGSVHDYSGTTLATNLGNKWFQLNVDHNLVTHTIRVWINQKLVWTQPDNGATDFYFKDGVYEQSHGPSYQMDTYITNTIQEWVSSGTNPPAAPTGLSAVPTTTQIPLTWNSSVGATNYNLKRSTTSGGFYATIASVSGTGYTDPNVIGGTIYYYAVSAVDQFGESSNSIPVAASLVNSGFQLSGTPPTAAIIAGGVTNYLVTMTTNTSFSGTTSFGIAGLPAGASANFTPSTLSVGGTSTLTVQTTSNTPGGNYVLTIAGTNGVFINTASVMLTLTGAAGSAGTLLWTGGSGADIKWFTVPNWTNLTAGGYGPPGISNNIVFTNTGANLSQGTVSSVVNSSVAILSLQYSQTNNFHTTQIAAGQTLVIATNLTAGTGTDLGAGGTLNAALIGSGALVIANPNCVVIVRQGTAAGSAPWSQRATLDLSGLDTFNASLGRVLVAGDGGSSAFNSRVVGTLYLARTNIISAAGAAPAIDVADNAANGAGAGADPAQLTSYLFLGLTNGIFADSIAVGRSKSAGIMAFNPAFTNNFTPSVYLRGWSAGRVANFSVGDDSAVGGSNQREAGAADFSGGMVDALIGTTYVGRSMNGLNTGPAASASGTLTFSAGTWDANILEIGYQTYASDTGPGATGTVNVNGTGLLKVNQTLELAHGTANSPLEQGTLNINGGTVQAADIIGGGGVSTINLNSGRLDLQFTNPLTGQIVNVSTLNIGAVNGDDPALLANAASISASSAINIAPNGILAGNTLITTPSLIVNGTLSPGSDGIGAMTNNGVTVFGAGGSFSVAVQNANGSPATSWDFLKAEGGLDIQSSNASPFTIQLASFDPNGSGLVTNFNSGMNYNWTIATAAGGIANFSPNKFAVDASAFANDLAGGTFSVQTNGSSLLLTFTSQPSPPIFGSIAFDSEKLVFSGTRGTADGIYYVLDATNLTVPATNWMRIATNQFDDSGGFRFTNAVSSGTPQQFYRLQLP